MKDIKVGGLPGVEFTHDRDVEGVKIVAIERLAITQDRAIRLVALAVKGKSAEAEKFFTSFQLLTDPTKKDK
jgi:hypothetical protein